MAFEYIDRSLFTSLHRAVINNNTSEVEAALSSGCHANLSDNRGWTALHHAATVDARVDCLKILLSHPSACINSQTFEGETALFLACQHDCLNVIELLLKYHNCNVNLGNTEGASPLHIACSKVNMNVVKLLLKHGANVNCQDSNGFTPLHEIVGFNYFSYLEDDITSIVSYLLTHQANPDLLEDEGNYPFHFACLTGHLKCVNLLRTASKLDNIVNCCNFDGRTPLMMAAQSKNLDLCENLLSLNAVANVVDKSNVTALHIAAHTGDFEIYMTIYRAMSEEFIAKYCTFDEERDFENLLISKNIHSVICLAIDTEDLTFLTNVLESGINTGALHCPIIHTENAAKKTFTLHTPISFLIESKMQALHTRTIQFLSTLISHGSPIKMTSKIDGISYVDPVCAALIALNDCCLELVMECLQFLLDSGFDPDYPYGQMPFAMEQACMRSCPEAVLLLLQFSNVIEPSDVLKWIEKETYSEQDQVVEVLLPLAPYYNPYRLRSVLYDQSTRMHLVAPKVHSLSSYCRDVIRKQLHKETVGVPTLFKKKLMDLGLPKMLYDFLCYK